MKALFSIANISSAPYMYKLIKQRINKIIFNIVIARLFNDSLYVLGILQNLTKIYL
jgi:hypothetical protein